MSLSDNFLAQMSEDPATKIVQGLQLGSGVAPGVSGGVMTVPFGITEEGMHCTVDSHTFVPLFFNLTVA